MRPFRFTAISLTVVLLIACGGDRTPGARKTVDGVPDEQLPTPEGTPGSAVTGMPGAPGPGQVGPPIAGEPDAVALDENGNPLPADAVPVDPAAASDLPLEVGDYPVAEGEPTAQEAVDVIREYYAAINGRNYARAFALWSDGGRATGQSPQQFADGFSDTNGVSVEVMAPGRVDAAAGSRHVEVPVALTATQDDGTERKYVGAYTLRRSVVDGATLDQQAWRIASADLREVQP